MEEFSRLSRMVEAPLVPARTAGRLAAAALRPSAPAPAPPAAEDSQAISAPAAGRKNGGEIRSIVERFHEMERVVERPVLPAGAPPAPARSIEGPARPQAKTEQPSLAAPPSRSTPPAPARPPETPRPAAAAPQPSGPAPATTPPLVPANPTRVRTETRMIPVYEQPLRSPSAAEAKQLAYAQPARPPESAQAKPAAEKASPPPAGNPAPLRETVVEHKTERRDTIRERVVEMGQKASSKQPEATPRRPSPAATVAPAPRAATSATPAPAISVRIGRIEIIARGRPQPSPRIVRRPSPHSIEAGGRTGAPRRP